MFIDPMSYSNLEVYDLELLTDFKEDEIIFVGNKNMKKTRRFYDIFLIYDYSFKRGLSKVMSYVISQLKVIGIINRIKPDIIHFQWFKIPFLDIFLLLFIKLFYRKIKLICTVHNILPHDSGNNLKYVFKHIYRKFDTLLVHDIMAKRDLISMFNISDANITQIVHGVIDLDTDITIVNQIVENNQRANNIVFGVLGNFNEYKGIDLVLDAWENISKENNVHLLIAGKGSVEALKNRSSDEKLTINNKYLSDEEFLAHVKISDVILLPYRKISQSGLLLTALSEKKYVIVSNVGGLTQPLKVANVGWVLENLNAESLERAMKESIDYLNQLDHKLIPENEFNKIMSHFSWSKTSKKLREIYTTI